ncbi:MAG: hypothetical protein JW822_01210 [Spirochaetales bacterium]|nr:hypothetical protein [Spirochaetales bacterium]
MKLKFIFILIAVSGFCLLFAADDMFNTSVSIDWANGILKITATTDLDLDNYPFPKARAKAEKVLYDNMPSLFIDALMDVPIDSYYTVREKLKDELERENLLQALSHIASKGKKLGSFVTDDFKYLKTNYVYPFYGEDGILSLLVMHDEPMPLRNELGFHATRKFSGVVIFAKGRYPVWGDKQKNESLIQRAFFPKIYDADMNIVLKKEMCDPHILRKWGIVAYSTSNSESQFGPRIGSFPLRIIAHGVYGKNNTDIIISREAAGQLLSLAENRALLTQGRILVIID